MAKYIITFSCGHTEEINLYGSYSSREEDIKWAEKYGQCNSCKDAEKASKRKQEHEEAILEAEKYNLPTLEGSEKQILWAIDIRYRITKELEKVCKGHSFEELKKRWDLSSEEIKEKMINANEDTYAYKLSRIFLEKSAKYYIDNQLL